MSSSAARRALAFPVDLLRRHQARTDRDIRRSPSRAILIVEFPGVGKTIIAAAYVRRAVEAGGRVLVLVHRGEILKQTLEKLVRAGLPASMIGVIWSSHAGLNADAPVQLASVQTLARRDLDLGELTHVVIDEAHHIQAKSWRIILARYPNARRLGLTATPERLDGKPLREFFDTMLLGEPPEQLIEGGWIVRPEIWTRADGLRPAVSKLKKRGGDYRPEEAAEVMSTIVGGLPEAYTKHANGLAAVGFAATTEQARDLVARFSSAGIESETLFGEDAETERDAKLARLKSGATKVLWTCDVLGEGWDYDGCRCVIMARPTASVARFIQWCGRAMRAGGRSVILDHAGNYYAHGAPWEERSWSLDGRAKRSGYVPMVDVAGRVTFGPPIEVDVELIRADEMVARFACAGVDGRCPAGARAPRSSWHRLTRQDTPWRCADCAPRHEKLAALRALAERRGLGEDWVVAAMKEEW